MTNPVEGPAEETQAVERREYPRDELDLGQQALRIVNKRWRGVRPSEKTIEKLAGPEEIKNRVRALFDMKKEQKTRLGQPISALSVAPQKRTWEKSLDRQATSYLGQLLTSETRGYNPAHLALTDGGLYAPEEQGILKAPTMEEAMEILEYLTLNEVELLKKILLEPEFSFIPIGFDWRKYIENLHTGVSPRYRTHLSRDEQRNFDAEREFDRQDAGLNIKRGSAKIVGWNICIGEGSKEGSKNYIGFSRDIISKWEKSMAHAAGFSLPTHQSYALDQKRKLILANKDPYQTPGKELMDTEGVSLLQRADNGRIICPDGSATVGCDGWRVLGVHRPDFSGYDARKGSYSGVRWRPQKVLRAK